MSLERTASTGWDIAKLEDVVDILDSKRVPINAKERETRGGQVPYYGATGQVGWIDDYLFDEELVLLGEDGAPFLDAAKQKAYVVRGKSWVNNHAHVLRARSDIPNAYIKYYLDTVDYHEFVTGTTRLKLNQAAMRRIPVPLAPPNERARIVAEIEKQFSRLDEAVANLKRTKANLKRYKAAVPKAAVEGKLTEDWRKQHPNVEPASKLLERILAERRSKWVGKGKYKEPRMPDVTELPQLPPRWSWCLTDALFSFVTSGSRGWAKYYSDEGPMFLRVGNLDHDSIRLDFSDLQRVRPPAGAEGTRTRVESGDILISITADVGMIAVVPAGLSEAYISQHVALARPLDGFCREYLAWYLAARDGGQKIFLQLQRGATKAGLGLDDIRTVPVPFPPLAEQEKIVAEVECRLSIIDELEATVEANFTRADRLRQSVLQQAFSGQLVAENRNTGPVSVLIAPARLESVQHEPTSRPDKPEPSIQEVTVTMNNLIEALTSVSDWISAQEAFRICGVGAGTETDAIERLYVELRGHVDSGRIVVNRRGEADWLRLSEHSGG